MRTFTMQGCRCALHAGGAHNKFRGYILNFLPGLLLGRVSGPMPSTLDEYHGKVAAYIGLH